MDYNLIEWSTLSQNRCPGLFRTIDGCPIIFYFQLDVNEVKNKFEELVKNHGGNIVDKYLDMTPYTVLMVDDKCVRSFYNRVSFKASYVIECVTNGTLLDINSYVHNSMTKFKINDYMKIVYLREATFVDDKVCTLVKNDIASSSTNSDTNVRKLVINQKVTAYSIKLEKNNLNKDKVKEDQCLNPCAHCMLQMNKNRNQADSSCTGEENHSSTPQTELRRAEEPVASTSRGIEHIEYPQINSIKILRSKSRKDEEEEDSCSSDSELLRPKEYCRTRRRIQISSDEDSNDRPFSQDNPSKCNRPLVNQNNKNIQILTEDEDDIGPATQSHISRVIADRKHSRMPYSRQEKEAILQFIVRKEAYHTVGGVNLWKKIERSNICPRRTWMSLQNHFKRSLLKELETFPFLTKHQINLLRG